MHTRFRDTAVSQMTGTGGLQRVPRDYVENFEIPLPPLEVQKKIVAEIQGYQKAIEQKKCEIHEEGLKIQSAIARIWGDEKGMGK